MKIFLKSTLSLVLLIFIILSCSKKTDREGCTDPIALNFNTLAVVDDGSCEYLDSSVTIWENGEVGYWGNELTGTFIKTSCYTGITTIFMNPDSAITPADTLIIPADTLIIPADTVIDFQVTPPDTTITPADTTITPADTTITPADTIITGDTYLLINSDSLGNYELIFQLLNSRNASDFGDGYLIFNAKLHPEATMSDFGVFIDGNHLNSGGSNCGTFLQSDPVNIITSSLDTNSFKEISIPLISFTNRYMQDVDLVFGIKGTNATPNSSLILINSIKWVTKLED
jgi:hypothetical protein